MNWNSSTVEQRSQAASTLQLTTDGVLTGGDPAGLNQLWREISSHATSSTPIQPPVAVRELVAL